MTDDVSKLLAALVDGKSAEDHVFTRSNGRPVRDFRVTWKNACAYAGVPDLLFHGVIADQSMR